MNYKKDIIFKRRNFTMIENETLKTIKARRSTKKFKSDMIDEEVLHAILEAGKYAPTGQGKQSPVMIAITNKEVRDELEHLNAKIIGNENAKPFYNAPVVVLVIANKNVGTAIYDGSCVMENLLLAASSLNIGACWIHRAKEEVEGVEGKELLKKLGIENPNDYIGVGHVILGYPDMNPIPAKPRKEDYIRYIK